MPGYEFDVVHVWLGLGLLVVLLAINDYIQEWRRAAGLRALAAALGLTFTGRRDDLASQQIPYFLSGTGRSCRNLLQGSWSGFAATAFDYKHSVVVGEAVVGTRRATRERTCVLAESGVNARQVDIAWRRTWDDFPVPGGMVEVTVGSEAFRRRWRVRASDPRFVQVLLDQPLIDWLLESAPDVRFELAGRSLLIVSARMWAKDVPSLVEVARDFTAHIPAQAKELYPVRL